MSFYTTPTPAGRQVQELAESCPPVRSFNLVFSPATCSTWGHSPAWKHRTSPGAPLGKGRTWLLGGGMSRKGLPATACGVTLASPSALPWTQLTLAGPTPPPPRFWWPRSAQGRKQLPPQRTKQVAGRGEGCGAGHWAWPRATQPGPPTLSTGNSCTGQGQRGWLGGRSCRRAEGMAVRSPAGLAGPEVPGGRA